MTTELVIEEWLVGACLDIEESEVFISCDCDEWEFLLIESRQEHCLGLEGIREVTVKDNSDILPVIDQIHVSWKSCNE